MTDARRAVPSQAAGSNVSSSRHPAPVRLTSPTDDALVYNGASLGKFTEGAVVEALGRFRQRFQAKPPKTGAAIQPGAAPKAAAKPPAGKPAGKAASGAKAPAGKQPAPAALSELTWDIYNALPPTVKVFKPYIQRFAVKKFQIVPPQTVSTSKKHRRLVYYPKVQRKVRPARLA